MITRTYDPTKWRLVPVEPDARMVNAARTVQVSGTWDFALATQLRAAIAAAPQPEPDETTDTIVHLREVDAGTPNACWFVCANGDKGAVAFAPHSIVPQLDVAAAVRAENEANATGLDMLAGKPQEIRLHAGELSASELRAVQAMLRFAAQAIRARMETK